MVQEAQHLPALYLTRRGRFGRVIKIQRNDVAQPLMRTLRVVMRLNGMEGAA